MSCFLAELHYVGIFKPAGRFRPRGGGRHGGRRTLGDRHFLSLSYSNRQLGSITVLRDLSHPVLSLMQIPQSNYSANLIPFLLAAFDRPDVSRVQLLVKNPGCLRGCLVETLRDHPLQEYHTINAQRPTMTSGSAEKRKAKRKPVNHKHVKLRFYSNTKRCKMTEGSM